jgi:hypothetical protein
VRAARRFALSGGGSPAPGGAAVISGTSENDWLRTLRHVCCRPLPTKTSVRPNVGC